MEYCGSCGKELTEGASFCSHCGASQQASAQATPQSPARKSRRMYRFLKWGGITVVGFVILLIVIGALVPPSANDVESESEGATEEKEENLALLEAEKHAGTLAENHFTAGNDHFRDNNYANAIAEFNEAIRLDPQYAEAFLRRGLAFYNLDQPDRAIENYNEVIRLAPDGPEAFVSRAHSYNRLCRSMDAIDDYHRAIRIDSGNIFIQYGLALAHADIGNRLEAERNLELANEAGY